MIFREGGREGEREGEKHQCVGETLIGCLLKCQGRGRNPGMHPDEELNWQHISLWDHTQPTEQYYYLKKQQQLDLNIILPVKVNNMTTTIVYYFHFINERR